MMRVFALRVVKFLTCLICLSVGTSQISMGQVTKQRLIEIPSSSCAVAVIQQSGSPLVIENARLYVSDSGKEPFLFYDIRNRSNRAVRFYSVVTRVITDLTDWYKFGNGGQEDVGPPSGKGPDLIAVGGTSHVWPLRNFEVVPMNDITGAFFSSQGTKSGLRGLWLITLKEVVFDDGSRFKATDPAPGIEDLIIGGS